MKGNLEFGNREFRSWWRAFETPDVEMEEEEVHDSLAQGEPPLFCGGWHLQSNDFDKQVFVVCNELAQTVLGFLWIRVFVDDGKIFFFKI